MINWNRFYDLNIQLTKNNQRSPNVASKLKQNLEDLALKYGEFAVNDAISRLRTPQQAQIPYIKAILKNNSRGGGNNHGRVTTSYQSEIDRAVAAVSSLSGVREEAGAGLHRGKVCQRHLPLPDGKI